MKDNMKPLQHNYIVFPLIKDVYVNMTNILKAKMTKVSRRPRQNSHEL